jgi:curli biogenesis system outer membrane secretion channel CsgG
MTFIIRTLAVLIGLTLLSGPARAADAPAVKSGRQTLALVQVTGGEGYNEAQTRTFEEMLLTALDATGRFKVVGRTDFDALLTLEAKKQAVGCGDSDCLVQIAGALGADLVGNASVGRLGENTMVSLKVMDVRKATVIARAQAMVKTKDELLNASNDLARQIVATLWPPPPPKAAEPPPPKVATLEPLTTRIVAATTQSSPSASERARPTVAVLYFDYDGSNQSITSLRKGLAQMLISDISTEGAVQIVERARLQEILAELKLGKSEHIDPATANKLGKLLGARFLVMGGYFEMMGNLRVDARIVEVETGRVVRSIGSHCGPDKFMDLEQQLAGELRTTLAATVPGASPASNPPTFQPPNQLQTMTVAHYGQALDELDRGHTAEARKQLQTVLKEAPDFALAANDLKKI